MTAHATGTFEVKLTPATQADAFPGRMLIDKQFHGVLEAVSHGEMLTAMTDIKGSAGYVAMERVQGTLDGRSGSFTLQHSGTMARGTQHLTITVVPDSGIGQLAGLAGTMTIKIEDGQHSYDLQYTIDASA